MFTRRLTKALLNFGSSDTSRFSAWRLLDITNSISLNYQRVTTSSLRPLLVVSLRILNGSHDVSPRRQHRVSRERCDNEPREDLSHDHHARARLSAPEGCALRRGCMLSLRSRSSNAPLRPSASRNSASSAYASSLAGRPRDETALVPEQAICSCTSTYFALFGRAD